MTLRDLLTEAAALYPVRETGAGWKLVGATRQYSTRAQALRVAAIWKIERVLLRRLNETPTASAEDVIRAAELSKQYAAKGGDWRDCARAALRELEGRAARSDRRT